MKIIDLFVMYSNKDYKNMPRKIKFHGEEYELFQGEYLNKETRKNPWYGYKVMCVLNDYVEVIDEPILDDKEKEYLSSVIKPFRNRINFIVKREVYYKRKEYISIYSNVDIIHFPLFPKNKLYKNMELNKSYSLEELGL